MAQNNEKTALIILDGWGHGKDPKVSAIAQAKTPFMDGLYQNYPYAELVTHGESVGLPEGQMGNSEVGHLNIGAGRIVYQELVRINKAIEDKTIHENPVIRKAIKYAMQNNKPIHIMGLLSDGGVHSHIDHLIALCALFNDYPTLKVYIHGFTDGRDTSPKGGVEYMKKLQKHISGTNATLTSIVGRYYAMDRDNRWERIKLAYDLLVHGKGEVTKDLIDSVQKRYEAGETDEFLKPLKFAGDDNQTRNIEEGDVVFFFNYRTDRPRQLTKALTQEDLSEFDMHRLSLHYLTMTEYDEDFENIEVVFTKENLKNTLGEVLSDHNKTQLRLAETEKYPHVTFFFSGGDENVFDGEKRILIPSPKVATYDLQPEMSAHPLTEALMTNIAEYSPDFVCLNYANTDMVGHTGVFSAAVSAAETVDACMAKLIPVLLQNEYHIIIIADHGNSDIMINPDGSPHTAHTTNLVPIIYVSGQAGQSRVKSGKLGDIAPTILSLMGIQPPGEMDGDVLIER